MLLKTLLNRVHPVKGFVYERDRLVPDLTQPNGVRIEADLRPRQGSRGRCSGCGRRGPTYDTQPARRFELVPLWGLAVTLRYAPRRIHCPHCGVKIEHLPWSPPGSKTPMTLAYLVYLASWARLLSWKQTAQRFGVSWESVYRAVQWVVGYGLAHRDLSGLGAIGVDEVATAKGHRYATLVYQLDEGRRRLLHVSEGRSLKSLLSFFHMLKREGKRQGQDLLSPIRFVCSDMWRPYLRVIHKKLPGALHILDRFHIVANLNKALDQVRAEEARKLAGQGWDVLKHARWLLLRRRKRLDGKRRWKLRQLLQWDLKTVRAYILEEGLQALWEYRSATYAGRFLDTWCRWAMRSRLEPIKKVARSLREHRESILNWFRAKKRFNAGIVEGLNGLAKLRFRKAFGFRTFTAMEVALYHELGDLPEPEITHRFC
jgi:transposase